MSARPISPLRQRILEDMTARRIGETTQSNYIRRVQSFTTFLGRSPDTATRNPLGPEGALRRALHAPKRSVSAPRGLIYAVPAAEPLALQVFAERVAEATCRRPTVQPTVVAPFLPALGCKAGLPNPPESAV